MLFNSVEFAIFFPLVTLLYFLLPHRFRWAFLLLASCVFYLAFIPVYIFILFFLITVDYFAALWIESAVSKKEKRRYLLVSITATCLILFIFKYFNFFNLNVHAIARFLDWNYPIPALTIILPIGLSFHTFQSLSYVIEVYRCRQRAEHNFGIYALYVMFYPQLVAGPIERPYNLLHQFYEHHRFDYRRVTNGLKLMTWGLFKKVVIADRLALFVNTAYGNPAEYHGAAFITATIFFAFQIYCDFSGYSDIAIGAAQVMGFRLMDNFNRPYFSKSVGEFWKRWHISLSSWFRDYVYIPLGGNRVSRMRKYYNLGIVFLISGLWHGANWTYLIWGALNGGYVIAGIATARARKKIMRLFGINENNTALRYMRVITTFLLISFSWIFFRANNVSDALYIVRHLFDGLGLFLGGILSNLASFSNLKEIIRPLLLGETFGQFCIAIGAILVLIGVHVLQRHGTIREMLSTRPCYVRWIVYYGMVIGIIFFGVFNRSSFIYFQF